MQIFDIHFLQPLYFYGFILVPIFLYLYIRQYNKSTININFWEDLEHTFWKNFFWFYATLFSIFLILSVFILLLADPNKANIKQNITKNWIDIVLALDISTSMNASDLKPNRLEKAKETITSFVEKQTTNRVWLVVFAGEPISSVPLTFDYNILIETLRDISTDTLNQRVNWLSWTAIWDSLLMSKNLFWTWAREKSIILLTDWDANTWVDPVLTSQLLAEENIKIYPIWIWSDKGSVVEVDNWIFKQEQRIPPLNVASLQKIAENTSGYFFRATDDTTLEKIFTKLEELEKNDIEVKIVKSFSEYYNPFIYTLIVLIASLYLLEIRRIKTN